MSKAKIFAAFLVGTALLGIAFARVTLADGPSSSAPSALAGTVTSQADGPMEGVLVGAKRAGSTISTWVVSSAQGQYSFPRDRMEPGHYAISIRAVGYELPATSVDLKGDTARLDLPLTKITRAMKIATQMSNAELIMSASGTPAQKNTLGGCVNCHTLQRVFFSHFDPLEMSTVAARMPRHTNNSSPMHPWFRPQEGPLPAITEPTTLGRYLSSINLSATDTFQFPLKTLPRPKGKATQVIYTVYDLPRPDASPHDIAFDADGNAWYSDFNSQYFGKVDVKTGKVVEYSPPLRRLGQAAQGGLQIDLDKQGRVYYGNMSQLQIVRLDPKTGKMETFQLPTPEATWGDGHLTMIDPAHMDVDGQLWFNIAFDTGESGGTWRVDLAKNKWTPITYPKGSPSARAYDVIADSQNNVWGMQMTNDKLWKTDAKTLQTTWYDFPTKGAGCRRGHMDSQERIWCGVFNGNRLAMFDTKTQKFTEWTVPTEWTRPYDAQFDDKTYAWTAGMDNDLAVRLNPQTGEFTEYLLPHETNVRHVEVQKSGALSSLWLGDQHGGTIIHIEPLAP
jgi:streptogramin lyase